MTESAIRGSHRLIETTPPALDAFLRCGCELVYDSFGVSPIFLNLSIRNRPNQAVVEERWDFEPHPPTLEYEDGHGNTIRSHRLAPGKNVVRHDAIVRVSSAPEIGPAGMAADRVEDLPVALLRYTLPSRYCDSDRLMDFAQERFGALPPGGDKVQAIADWLQANIEYRTGSGSPLTSASEVINQRFGVCRDFAHTLVALCRCSNLPARYVTGYVPEMGFFDPGTPNDFHAYAEVWLGGAWVVVDARFNTRRIGRVHIAQGADAVDGAFATVFGSVQWISFNVWGYQVPSRFATLSRPVDLADRICGTPLVRVE